MLVCPSLFLLRVMNDFNFPTLGISFHAFASVGVFVIFCFRSAEELQLAENHAMRKLLPDTLAHLSSTHLQYFTHWFLCMELEQAVSSQKGISGIWCLSSAER